MIDTPAASESLNSRTAVITGAGSGIGQAMARLFAAHGAAVAAFDIDIDKARSTADEIIAGGGICTPVACDVSSAESVERAVAETLRSSPTIDILCSNAGILDDYAPLLETTEETWDRVMGINLRGVFLTARAIVPHMLDQGAGTLVNTASISGFVAGGGGAAYTASKHGVIGLTKQISHDYGARGIRANAICPGAVETAMTREIFDAGDASVMDAVRSVPAGRFAQPEEIARLALFLASDASSFMHGSAVVIDGGWTIS